MARQILTRILCDMCLSLEDGPEVDEGVVESPPITIGNRKPRVIALCPDHITAYEEFVALLENLGTPAPAPGATSSSRKHHATGTSSTKGSTAAQATLPLEDEAGPGRPGRDDRNKPGALICPLPGCGVGKLQRSALRDHARRDHQVILGVLEARHGNGYSVEGAPLTQSCDYCDAKFTHGAGLAAHVKADHPDKWAPATGPHAKAS